MRLRAAVRGVSGNVTHLHGAPTSGTIKVTKVPDPRAVEIVDQGGAFYLLRLDGEGRCIANTWHENVEGARAQANFEFGIQDKDWKDIGSH